MSPTLRFQIQRFLKPALQFVSYLLYALLPVSYLFRGPELRGLSGGFGEYALNLLWVTMIPGILKRFQVKGLLLDVQIILMGVRRQLGIVVFLLALTHFAWGRAFMYVEHGLPNLKLTPRFEVLGMMALLLLLFLFVTSNDYSVRILKKNWNRIHALVYAVIWIVALHVSLLGGEHFIEHGLPTIAVGVLQIASYVYKWRNAMVPGSPPTRG